MNFLCQSLPSSLSSSSSTFPSSSSSSSSRQSPPPPPIPSHTHTVFRSSTRARTSDQASLTSLGLRRRFSLADDDGSSEVLSLQRETVEDDSDSDSDSDSDCTRRIGSHSRSNSTSTSGTGTAPRPNRLAFYNLLPSPSPSSSPEPDLRELPLPLPLPLPSDWRTRSPSILHVLFADGRLWRLVASSMWVARGGLYVVLDEGVGPVQVVLGGGGRGGGGGGGERAGRRGWKGRLRRVAGRSERGRPRTAGGALEGAGRLGAGAGAGAGANAWGEMEGSNMVSSPKALSDFPMIMGHSITSLHLSPTMFTLLPPSSSSSSSASPVPSPSSSPLSSPCTTTTLELQLIGPTAGPFHGSDVISSVRIELRSGWLFDGEGEALRDVLGGLCWSEGREGRGGKRRR